MGEKEELDRPEISGVRHAQAVAGVLRGRGRVEGVVSETN